MLGGFKKSAFMPPFREGDKTTDGSSDPSSTILSMSLDDVNGMLAGKTSTASAFFSMHHSTAFFTARSSPTRPLERYEAPYLSATCCAKEPAPTIIISVIAEDFRAFKTSSSIAAVSEHRSSGLSTAESCLFDALSSLTGTMAKTFMFSSYSIQLEAI